jgi:hypothetical protein
MICAASKVGSRNTLCQGRRPSGKEVGRGEELALARPLESRKAEVGNHNQSGSIIFISSEFSHLIFGMFALLAQGYDVPAVKTLMYNRNNIISILSSRFMLFTLASHHERTPLQTSHQ